MKFNEQLNRMKHLMGIKESVSHLHSDKLLEYFLDAENIEEKINPDEISSTFSVEELTKITNFKDRVLYCNKTLKFMGQGSSRRVYELPDGLNVLKLAKNTKGIAQNEAEVKIGGDSFGYSIIAELKYEDHLDEHVLFVIMEKAVRINENDFTKITDIPFNEFSALSYNRRSHDFVDSAYKLQSKYDSEKSMDFINDLNDYIMGTGLNKLGDLGVITSYGKVMREGQETIVLVDYGLTDEVGANYYGM